MLVLPTYTMCIAMHGSDNVKFPSAILLPLQCLRYFILHALFLKYIQGFDTSLSTDNLHPGHIYSRN